MIIKIKSTKGFAGMDKEKQRAIASLGGKASQERGVGHKFSKEEARIAGQKGGKNRWKKRDGK